MMRERAALRNMPVPSPSCTKTITSLKTKLNFDMHGEVNFTNSSGKPQPTERTVHNIPFNCVERLDHVSDENIELTQARMDQDFLNVSICGKPSIN